MNKQELYEKCLEKWGLLSQILMVAEESCELTHAALGLNRASKQEGALDHFAEEIADVELMIDEMKHYYHYENLRERVDAWRLEKEERLCKKVEGEDTQ